jgi:soluble lytic murein transglycosylase-like protein
VALFLLAAQFAAMGADIAVLRNGFEIHHQRREQRGNLTRLYTADGYVDIPTEQIATFEAEETPAPEPPEAQQPPQPQVQAPTPVATAANIGTANASLDEVVREASAKNQLDPDFVNSVIKAESNFYPHAVSPKGAQGLMQLMPETAALLGVHDPFDPRANVEAGTAYLNQLLNQYNDDPIRALAAYNAGPQRVQQYHGVPPYRETKLYIARIVRDYNAKKAREKGASAKTQAAANHVPASQVQANQVQANQAPAKKTSGSNGSSRKAAASGKTTSKSKQQQASLSSPPGPDAAK